MRKNLIWQIVGAFILAIITGLIFGEHVKVVQPLGDLFLRLIKFIIVPLILSTIIVGVTSTGDIKRLGRLGGKTITYYLVTSFIAISLGLLAGFIFSPGKGLEVKLSGEEVDVASSGGVVQTLLNIIPTNPIESLTNGDMLQIIFFAIFVGIGITIVGTKADPVKHFFDGFAEIMYKITGIVMNVVPIGIFGLMVPIVGEYGATVLLPLIKLIIAMLITCLLHIIIGYFVAVKTMGKMKMIQFLKGIFPAAAVAFSTSSSAGTLPVTMKSAEDNLKVSKETSSVVLPLGARSEEHTSELQSRFDIVCRLLLEKKNNERPHMFTHVFVHTKKITHNQEGYTWTA